jgi:3-carboxy-cis,cis-muconate cycloisomerase
MRANISGTGGTVFAERAMMLLAPSLGREAAHTLVGKAAAEALTSDRGLGAALAGAPEVKGVLSAADLSSLDDPGAYLGVAERLRLRLLANS